MTHLFKFLNNLKLSVRLNLITAVVLVLLFLVTSLVSSIGSRGMGERTGRQRAAEEVEVIRSHLVEAEQRLLIEAKVVATTPSLIEAVASHDLPKLRTEVLVVASPFAFDKLEIVDLQKVSMTPEAVPGEAGVIGKDELISLALLGAQKTAITVETGPTPKLQLSTALPLKDRSGALIGALLVSRTLDDDFLASLDFSREKVYLVLLYTGKPIAQHVSILLPPAELPNEDRPGTDNSSQVSLQELFPQLIDAEALEQVSKGEVFVRDHFIYDTLDGHAHSASYLPLLVEGRADAVIAILYDQSEISVFQKQLLSRMLGASIFLTIATIGVMALFFRHSIAMPLSQLGRAAERMAAGDLNARASNLESKSEIGLLTASFNKMADELQQTLAHLEQRVAERTAELEATNRQLSQEIAERKQAQLALSESETRFRRVVSSISDHIYVTEFSVDGRPINGYISPNAADLTGYPAEKLMADWSFWPTVIIHPDDQTRAAEQARRLSKGQASQVEYRLVQADGNIIWVRDSGRVEKDPVSQQLTVYGIVSNITARKQAEEALAEARDQALEASRLKTQLLANVSHDLRTPLNAILGYAEMLQEGLYGPVSADQKGALADILDSTGQLLNFIRNLLNQAQIESGKIILKTARFAPADLLETANSISILARAKDVALTVEMAPDIPPQLYGDFYWLRQILLNLVGNAIKFTEPGGTVNAALYRPDETHWALQVTDTGCGIPPEAQTYIFEAFRQVDGTMTRLHSGSGVGLAIVKQLAVLMNGQISLDSQVGRGSTFTVSLPIISA